ncbi:hypothetical protein GCM10011344_27170 [Dokdonia pacifica]|uniref:Uncharacterized protein n=1 Tax=Dokdonia pacifica TaxID=1627892 RepID=A0A239E6V7_9FLAO|nr:hypothetical protein [Dokdonia pacifica]GGG25078.1 hypothetical protein GCM10011344_27170 [Dokdonia pacifica]SNS40179.1 hypothetical protein SAMN06265376_11427 [Dokdonia pacifica]
MSLNANKQYDDTETFNYTSLYEYLEINLHNKSQVSDEDIILLKKEYWRLWYRHYRREQRKKRKEFTLGFNDKQLSEIERQKGSYTISEFLYQAIASALTGKSISQMNTASLGLIHQTLLHLIHLLEELEDDDDTTSIRDEIFERLSALEQQFENTFKKKEI